MARSGPSSSSLFPLELPPSPPRAASPRPLYQEFDHINGVLQVNFEAILAEVRALGRRVDGYARKIDELDALGQKMEETLGVMTEVDKQMTVLTEIVLKLRDGHAV